MVYLGLQKARREPVRKALVDLCQSERVSRDSLFTVQDARLLALLRYAVDHVSYYREAFQPFRQQIENAESRESVEHLMRNLPVLKKGEVVGREAEFRSDRIERIRTSPNRTSGSTGTPLVFPCDKVSWAYRHALHFRGARWFGVDVGEPYAYFFGLHWNKRTRTHLKIRDFAMNRVRVSAYDLSEETFQSYLARILKFGVTHFLGYPASIYDFCLMSRARGISLKRLELKAVFSAGEPLLPIQKDVIQEVTDAPCVNTYGSVEGGLAAFECPSGSFHVMSEAVWLQPGANGALVTDLFLRAFPLINYEIGDDVEFDDAGSFCTCGLSHPIIKGVMGRTGDPIELPNGRVINSHVPGYIFKPLADLGAVRKFRFVERAGGGLELLLVVTSTFEGDHIFLIRDEIEEAFGPGLDLDIRIVDEIPFLPNAKHRSYVKEVTN